IIPCDSLGVPRQFPDPISTAVRWQLVTGLFRSAPGIRRELTLESAAKHTRFGKSPSRILCAEYSEGRPCQVLSGCAGDGGDCVTSKESGPAIGEPIAVVGMSCRLPRAADPGRFWQVLRGGVDAVTEVPEGRWPDGGTGVRRGAFLDEVDGFDAGF